MYGKAWIISKAVPADILSYGAFTSTLRWKVDECDGFDVEVEQEISNEEFLVIWEVENNIDDE